MPRRYLNDDEEMLVQLRPHWIFFAGPLAVTVAAVAIVITIIVAEPSVPNWLADGLWILAAIPGVWLLGRLARWRLYTFALTTTRILVRRNVFDRDIVQIRLQRITGLNLSQTLLGSHAVHRAPGRRRAGRGRRGRPSVHPQADHPPTGHQRSDQRARRWRQRRADPRRAAEHRPRRFTVEDIDADDGYTDDGYTDDRPTDDGPETPPFGVPPVAAEDHADVPHVGIPPTPVAPATGPPRRTDRGPPKFATGSLSSTISASGESFRRRSSRRRKPSFSAASSPPGASFWRRLPWWGWTPLDTGATAAAT